VVSVGYIKIGSLILAGCVALSAVAAPSALGTWREGFKAAYAKALTFTSWDELYDWAEGGESSVAPPLKLARSTDLAGGRHTYTDTYAAGFRDGRIVVYQEMRFIGNHNAGDTEHFFKMTQEWIKMQTPDQIIPPGHF
jgi:hypothetical protein